MFITREIHNEGYDEGSYVPGNSRTASTSAGTSLRVMESDLGAGAVAALVPLGNTNSIEPEPQITGEVVVVVMR